MSFKENVKSELEFKGILIKELALASGINRRTLDNYLRSNESQPTVENAVRIARALGVSVEYLVTGQNAGCAEGTPPDAPDLDLRLCKKYYALFRKLDSLPGGIRDLLCRMIEELPAQYAVAGGPLPVR